MNLIIHLNDIGCFAARPETVGFTPDETARVKSSTNPEDRLTDCARTKLRRAALDLFEMEPVGHC